MKNEVFIQELIEKRAFSELSDLEKKEVLKFISEKEYNDRRILLLNAEEVFMNEEEILPDPEIFNQLKNKLDPPKGGKLIAWFAYKMPAYQSAAILILVALFAWLKPAQTTVQYVQGPEKVIHETLYDTVYLEAKAPEVVEKVKYVKVANNETCVPKGLNRMANNEKSEMNLFQNKSVLQDANEKFESQLENISAPASSNEAMEKFMVSL